MSTALRILIAHDHDLTRILLIQLIAQTYPSATITAATNGTEALAAFAQYGADLLITNGRMPGMGGADLIRALRAQPATCPILMVSSDRSLEAAALGIGANKFLGMPFDLTEFQQAVTILLAP
jgi:DNA-binding NarL/FixJ family response regulator